MISAVGRRYAKALVDVVTAPGSTLDPNQALAQLRAANELIASIACRCTTRCCRRRFRRRANGR